MGVIKRPERLFNFLKERSLVKAKKYDLFACNFGMMSLSIILDVDVLLAAVGMKRVRIEVLRI